MALVTPGQLTVLHYDRAEGNNPGKRLRHNHASIDAALQSYRTPAVFELVERPRSMMGITGAEDLLVNENFFGYDVAMINGHAKDAAVVLEAALVGIEVHQSPARIFYFSNGVTQIPHPSLDLIVTLSGDGFLCEKEGPQVATMLDRVYKDMKPEAKPKPVYTNGQTGHVDMIAANL